MHKEACEITAAPKMEAKPSAGDLWTALEQKPIRTAVDQPHGSTSNRHSTSVQGQSDMVIRRPTVKKYLDRITISGLHNYLYAIERYEKVTWNLTFLVSIIGTLFYLVSTIRAYLEFAVVLDIHQTAIYAFRAPNVWVCVEAINASYISEHFEKARPKLLVDRRIRHLAKRFTQRYKPGAPYYTQWNWTTMVYDTVPSIWNSSTMSWEFRLEDIIDVFILWSKLFSLTTPISDEFGKVTNFAHTLVELLYRGVTSAGDDWLGYKTFYEEGMFSCESVLKNCTHNGVPFDCCTDGSMGYTQTVQRCFKLDMRQLKTASASECQPLRESWSYDYRASSMIAAGPEGNILRYFRNKVIVIIDPEYRVETEVYKMGYLSLAASLGVAFGCILGISAITLIQLPIWTIVALVMQRKLSKISPLSRQGAIHSRPDVHLHANSTV